MWAVATAPDKPGIHATVSRDHEYTGLGTLSLLAGIDLLHAKTAAIAAINVYMREHIKLLEQTAKLFAEAQQWISDGWADAQ